MSLTNKQWRAWLKQEMSQDAFLYAIKQVEKEKKSSLVFPREDLWLRPLDKMAVEGIKVVLVGTRPMGIPSFSDGLAYSSLGEETKDMRELHYLCRELVGQSPSLVKDEWMINGVLLLNRELTSSSVSGIYRTKNPHKYWLLFTENVIQRLVNDDKERVFILADKQGYENLRNPHGHPLFFNLRDGIKYLVENEINVFGGELN